MDNAERSLPDRFARLFQSREHMRLRTLEELLKVPPDKASAEHINNLFKRLANAYREECSIVQLGDKYRKLQSHFSHLLVSSLEYVDRCASGSGPDNGKMRACRTFYQGLRASVLKPLLLDYHMDNGAMNAVFEHLTGNDIVEFFYNYVKSAERVRKHLNDEAEIEDFDRYTALLARVGMGKLNRQQTEELKQSIIKKAFWNPNRVLDSLIMIDTIHDLLGENAFLLDDALALRTISLTYGNSLSAGLEAMTGKMLCNDELFTICNESSASLRETAQTSMKDAKNSMLPRLDFGITLLEACTDDNYRTAKVPLTNLEEMLDKYAVRIFEPRDDPDSIKDLAVGLDLCWDSEKRDLFAERYMTDIQASGGTMIVGVYKRDLAGPEGAAFCRGFLGIDRHGKRYLHVDIIEGPDYCHGPNNFKEAVGDDWPFWLGLSTLITLGAMSGVDYVSAGDTGVADVFESLGFKKRDIARRYGVYKVGMQPRRLSEMADYREKSGNAPCASVAENVSAVHAFLYSRHKYYTLPLNERIKMQ